jgi:multisubunit Na+/H+ antiporter MnhF subunit
VNGWLWTATVLGGALAPLVLVAALGNVHQGLVAIEAAGVDLALALLLLAEGTQSQSFATLALVTAVMSFVGSIAYIRFLLELESVKA